MDTKKIKILHINVSDRIGGAAIAALRLHEAMSVAGINSKYLVLNSTINDRGDIKRVSKYDYYIKRILNMIFEKMAIKNMHGVKGLFSSFKYGINISKYSEISEADIIYLHWINSFINYHILKKILQTGKPVFWFLHDMFAITGGCHISFDCIKYQSQCCRCPYHGNGSSLTDLSIRQYKIKKKLYEQFDNLSFITPSKWLFECVRKSRLTKGKEIYHIPNLVDGMIFKPINKEMARSLFSLDYNKKIIGFGADSALTNPYKGWSYLKDALHLLAKEEALKNADIELLIFGSSYSKEVAESIPFRSHFLGNLKDEYSLIMAYNCMDVFVIPSLAESFGQTIIESLACDVPVVGFNVGGIPDTVNTDTGYLAEYKNSTDLAQGISLLLRQEKKDVRSYIMSFTTECILKKHKNIFNVC